MNLARLSGEIERLAELTEVAPPAVTRVIFSDQDLAARELVKTWCRQAGLLWREDAVGNLFARWEGTDPSLPAVATGSHIDAIPQAGRYDGVVGVLGGLEAIRSLKESGRRLRRSIELITFTSEEPTRFGIGCLGSRLLAGSLQMHDALGLTDGEGRTLQSWLDNSPYAAGDRAAVRLDPGRYHAFAELHIEQGPVLEREGLDLGAVTHIAAPASYRVSIAGQGGHAGGVLMPDRHDALCGSSEFVLALERLACASASPDTVATTGGLRVSPGAINSIPDKVEMEVDLRDIDPVTRAATWAAATAALEEIVARRGLSATVVPINEDPPATCDAGMVAAVEGAAAERGYAVRRLISRAYHDSLFMARLAPTVMIFIPCRNGWSHRPDEFSSPEQIEKGVIVLAEVLAREAK